MICFNLICLLPSLYRKKCVHLCFPNILIILKKFAQSNIGEQDSAWPLQLGFQLLLQTIGKGLKFQFTFARVLVAEQKLFQLESHCSRDQIENAFKRSTSNNFH